MEAVSDSPIIDFSPETIMHIVTIISPIYRPNALLFTCKRLYELVDLYDELIGCVGEKSFAFMHHILRHSTEKSCKLLEELFAESNYHVGYLTFETPRATVKMNQLFDDLVQFVCDKWNNYDLNIRTLLLLHFALGDSKIDRDHWVVIEQLLQIEGIGTHGCLLTTPDTSRVNQQKMVQETINCVNRFYSLIGVNTTYTLLNVAWRGITGIGFDTNGNISEKYIHVIELFREEFFSLAFDS